MRSNPSPSSLENQYYILGGQHIAAVIAAFLAEARTQAVDLKEIGKTDEEKKMQWLSYVSAEVCHVPDQKKFYSTSTFLIARTASSPFCPSIPFRPFQVMRTDCPIHVRRLAAGSHNRQQEDAAPPELADMATFIKFQYESMGIRQGGRMTDEQLYLTLKESGCTLKLQTTAKAQVKRGSAKKARIEDTAVVHDDDLHVCSLVPPILCATLAAHVRCF